MSQEKSEINIEKAPSFVRHTRTQERKNPGPGHAVSLLMERQPPPGLTART